jgi:hypothetical protein
MILTARLVPYVNKIQKFLLLSTFGLLNEEPRQWIRPEQVPAACRIDPREAARAYIQTKSVQP